MGQIYVQVDANAANGIMTLNASGGGEEGGSYWIHWDNSTGFSGTSWRFAWDSKNTPLEENWTKDPAEGYTADFDGFYDYVQTASSLDRWLGESWSDDAKKAFINENYPVLWNNCTTPA